eukprot:4405796-Pleurochrysis_carterae.AAC.1
MFHALTRQDRAASRAGAVCRADGAHSQGKACVLLPSFETWKACVCMRNSASAAACARIVLVYGGTRTGALSRARVCVCVCVSGSEGRESGQADGEAGAKVCIQVYLRKRMAPRAHHVVRSRLHEDRWRERRLSVCAQ